MLKSILKIDGAQQLSKAEQKSINGGSASLDFYCCILIWHGQPVLNPHAICQNLLENPNAYCSPAACSPDNDGECIG